MVTLSAERNRNTGTIRSDLIPDLVSKSIIKEGKGRMVVKVMVVHRDSLKLPLTSTLTPI